MRGTRRAARASRRTAGPPTLARIWFLAIGLSRPEYGLFGGQECSTDSIRRSATAASLTAMVLSMIGKPGPTIVPRERGRGWGEAEENFSARSHFADQPRRYRWRPRCAAGIAGD